MENNLVSDRDGVIAAVLVDDGDVIATDQPIVEFAGAGGAPKAAAPKPVAAPKPAPKPAKEEPKQEVKPVQPVDINRVLSPVEGGSASHATLPNTRRDSSAPAIRLAEGTTMEINVNPDGSINIRISTGK